MARLVVFLFAVGLFALPGLAQPVIRGEGVVNASNYRPGIARGSWFVIFGTNLGPANISIAPAVPFPLELSGTRVTFTPAAGGTAVECRIWYTLSTQIAALLPSPPTAGQYDVRVIYNNQTSAPIRVAVVTRNLGAATVAESGLGPIQATNASLNGGISLVRFTTGTISFGGRDWQYRPAYPGETLVLWGTGIGPDGVSDVSGGSSGDMTAALNLRVVIDGTEIRPAYAGRSNGSPGLDQINFTLPANVTLGCFVRVQVLGSGINNDLGTLAIASAGSSQCAHPVLTESQLRRLDQRGTVTIGNLGLSKFRIKFGATGHGPSDADFEGEFVGGEFDRYSIDRIGANFSLHFQPGSCYSYALLNGEIGFVLGGIPAARLNAGNQLTLNGPNVSNRAVPFTGNSTYDATLYVTGMGNPVFAQGAYTITGSGGPDVGPFSASTNFPGAFTWTNEANIAGPISRNQDLQITWTGGGNGVVLVQGFAGTVVSGEGLDGSYNVTVFACVAQASTGSLTVPSAVLSRLPQVAGNAASRTIGALLVGTGPDYFRGQGVFTAPLTAGGNVDMSFFNYAVATLKLLGYN
jgi:uncharacterized protein (TIGR03437 family)